MTDTQDQPLLGLATTRQLLDELEVRAMVPQAEYVVVKLSDLPRNLFTAFAALRHHFETAAGGLDYRTTGPIVELR